MRVFTITLLASLIAPVIAAFAQEIDTSMWATDGLVRSMVESEDGQTLFIGGGFRYVGPITGAAVPLSLNTGEALPTYPYVNGIVHTIVNDGLGGWIIGGEFDQVGPFERRNMARISPEGSVYPDWAPQVDSTVFSMVISGERLFIGGHFKTVNGMPRAHVAALSVQNGGPVPLNQWNVQSDTTVRAMAILGSSLILGGQFTSINGTSRTRLAAVSVNTGNLNSWNPEADKTVYAVRVTGPRIYVGGTFEEINNQDRKLVAAFDAATGNLLPWAPSIESPFNALKVVRTIDVAGGFVYVGGFFDTVQEQPRNNLARIPEDSGNNLNDTWAPNPNGNVYTLLVHDGSVYIGGEFTEVANQERLRLAMISTAGSANLGPWTAKTNGGVYSIRIRIADGVLYTGGRFTSAGGVSRRNVASLDINTREPKLWNPTTDGTVDKLLISGSTIYVAGAFSSIGGVLRSRIAALDSESGQVKAFAAVPTSNGNQFSLTRFHDLALAESGLILAGNFLEVNGQTRRFIAKVNPQTGQTLDWNPDLNHQVNSIAVRDTTVFIGGAFSTVGGQSRSKVAEISLASGRATEWNPGLITRGFVGSEIFAVSVTDSVVYVAGKFTEIDGISRTDLAALNRRTGDLEGLNVPFDDSREILAMVVTPSTIYLGGLGFIVNGLFVRALMAVDRKSGEIVWNPGVTENINAVVNTIVLSEKNNRIYLGQWNILSISGIRAGTFSAVRNPSEPGLYPARVPALISPTGGTAVEGNVTLTWEPIEFADWYRIQVSRDDQFQSPTVDTILIGTTSLHVDLSGAATHYWRVRKGNDVRQSDWSVTASFSTGGVTAVEGDDLLPLVFELRQNYPNPFNPSTRIGYSILQDGSVLLRVFDILGREVATLVDGFQRAGRYEAVFDASHLPSGQYLYRLESVAFSETKRMMLTK